ncbi:MULTISPECIES: hypothetical protein [unclassified Streptosporangium]|uniref:hypothetical protein n=1 Tax=unclassified Streptosporangium TaxID=2632669 RepID=UPI002E2A1FEB|nr:MULTISPECIES: hypothetical protein [unclassified Streptosporangium]
MITLTREGKAPVLLGETLQKAARTAMDLRYKPVQGSNEVRDPQHRVWQIEGAYAWDVLRHLAAEEIRRTPYPQHPSIARPWTTRREPIWEPVQYGQLPRGGWVKAHYQRVGHTTAVPNRFGTRSRPSVSSRPGRFRVREESAAGRW